MTGLAPAAILWMLFAVGLAAAYSPLPRRPERADIGLGSSEDEDEWVNEDGWDRTPGQEPREVGLP